MSTKGTVAQTDMSRATDSREKDRIGIFGTDLSYAGSYGRVTSESIGRDLNPLGRGDGAAYVAGAINLSNINPAEPMPNTSLASMGIFLDDSLLELINQLTGISIMELHDLLYGSIVTYRGQGTGSSINNGCSGCGYGGGGTNRITPPPGKNNYGVGSCVSEWIKKIKSSGKWPPMCANVPVACTCNPCKAEDWDKGLHGLNGDQVQKQWQDCIDRECGCRDAGPQCTAANMHQPPECRVPEECVICENDYKCKCDRSAIGSVRRYLAELRIKCLWTLIFGAIPIAGIPAAIIAYLMCNDLACNTAIDSAMTRCSTLTQHEACVCLPSCNFTSACLGV